MEFKTLGGLEPVEITDRTVKGFASVFGNVDDGGDVTHPRAFAKTLAEGAARLRFLWQHDTEAPPTAAIKSAREVKRDDLPAEVKSKYPQATGGLLVEREYLDTPRGNEILAGYKAGISLEMSFGYETIKSDFSTLDNSRVRNLRELKLYEMSDVLWGMNPATVGLAKAKQQAGTKGMMLWDLMWQVRAGQDVAALLQAGSALSSDQLNQISGIMGLLAQVLERAEEISCQQEEENQAPNMDTMTPDSEDESYGTMAATYLDLVTHGAGWLKYLPASTFRTGTAERDRARITKTIAALNQLATAAEPGTPLTAKPRIQLALAKLRILDLECSTNGTYGNGRSPSPRA